MKTLIGTATATATAVVAAVLPMTAAADARLAQRNNCTNCHAVDATGRQGSSLSFPALAAKHGQLGADQLVKQLRDGSTQHPPIRGNEAQTRQIVQWMLTLK
jgi:mono/diheme cytochrome c family protein